MRTVLPEKSADFAVASTYCGDTPELRRPSPEEGSRLMRAFYNIRSRSRREAIIKLVLESEAESASEM